MDVEFPPCGTALPYEILASALMSDTGLFVRRAENSSAKYSLCLESHITQSCPMNCATNAPSMLIMLDPPFLSLGANISTA